MSKKKTKAPKAHKTKAAKKATAKKKERKHPFNALKKAAKGLGKGLKKIGKGIGKGVKKVGNAAKEAAEFAALLPFKPLMVAALKKKGVKVTLKTKTKLLASLFMTHVIAKQHLDSVYNTTESHLEHLGSRHELDTKSYYDLLTTGSLDHLDDAGTDKVEDAAFAAAGAAAGAIPGGTMAITIIHKIIDYFKGAQRKKKAASKKDELVKEAIDKGESPEAAEKTADAEIAKDPELTLTPEEKEVVDADAPLTQDEHEAGTGADKVQDALSEHVKGSIDSDGNEKESEDRKEKESVIGNVKEGSAATNGSRKFYGFMGMLSHNKD